MSLREKIIVAVAGLALIWGIYEVGIKSILDNKKPGDKQKITEAELKQDLSVFTEEISQKVSSVNLNQKELFIISKSSEKFKKDPFISYADMETIKNRDKTDLSESSGNEPVQSLFKYLGYIEISDMKIAVINNIEYKKNERIENTRFRVKDISPSKVILSNGVKNFEIFNEDIKPGLNK
jgi:tRNA U34 5-carboxymethylaminomethyl modifying enzyme MnmG/GidA